MILQFYLGQKVLLLLNAYLFPTDLSILFLHLPTSMDPIFLDWKMILQVDTDASILDKLLDYF